MEGQDGLAEEQRSPIEYDERFDFDCPQFTDFANEAEVDEWSEVQNEDGFFAVRSEKGVDVPDEWLQNLQGSSMVGIVPQTPIEEGEEDEEEVEEVEEKSPEDGEITHGTGLDTGPNLEPSEIIVDEIKLPVSADKAKRILGSPQTPPEMRALEHESHQEEILKIAPEKDPKVPKTLPLQRSRTASTESSSTKEKKQLPSYLQPTRTSVNRARKMSAEAQAAADAAEASRAVRKEKARKAATSHVPKPRATSFRPSLKRLTEPHTPLFSTSNRRKKEPVPSSTTQELQKIAEEARKKREEDEAHQRKLQKMKEGDGSRKPDQHKPLTRPESPNLQIHKRVGKEAPHKKQADVKAKKERATASKRGPVKLTRPKEFNFATDKRVHHHAHEDLTETRSPFESMASKVHKFSHKTPARFRAHREVECPEPEPVKLTEPQEIRFATDGRPRKPKVKSSQEIEEAEMKKFKPFKARPVPENILHSSGELGVPKVEKKAPAVAIGFNFRTDERAHSRRRSVDVTNKGDKSIAKDAPRRPTSTKSAGPMMYQLTKVQPFNFMTDCRATRKPPTPSSSKEEEEVSKSQSFKARRMPDFSKVPSEVQHQVQKREIVQAEPFELRSLKRHEEAQRKFQEDLKRQQEEEERSRSFKARPISYSEAHPEIIPSEKPLTEPHTPMTLKRSLTLQEEKQRRLQEEQERKAVQNAFHARPLPRSTFQKDFSPERPHMVTGVLDVKLHSDGRAIHRAEFERELQMKEKLKEEEALRECERKQKEEVDATKEYRKSLVHKPRPVPDYSRPTLGANPPQPPQRLTEPESPNFMLNKRYPKI